MATQEEIRRVVKSEIRNTFSYFFGVPLLGALVGAFVGTIIDIICILTCPSCNTGLTIIVGGTAFGGVVGLIVAIGILFGICE